nr:nucleocapsid protein [Drosophila busckii rhabdovirus]
MAHSSSQQISPRDVQILTDGHSVVAQMKGISSVGESEIQDLPWTESTFGELLDMYGWKVHPEDTVINGAASSILNWYMGGPTKNLLQSIEVVIAGMTVSGSGTPLITIKDRGTKSTHKWPSIVIPKRLDGDQLAKWKPALENLDQEISIAPPALPTSVEGAETTRMATSQTEAGKWYDFMWDGLNTAITAEDPKADEIRKKRQFIINYVGYIGLNLLRGVAKGSTTVIRALEKNLVERIPHFWPTEFQVPPPPMGAQSAIQEIENMLERGSEGCRRLIVNMIPDTLSTEPAKKGILMSGCMKSLSDSGLGALHWVYEAAAYLTVEPGDLMETMYYGPFIASSQEVAGFLSSMHGLPKEWKWARVINEGYISKLSVRNNKKYVATLVALSCGMSPDSPIWAIPSLAINNLIKREALDNAQAIYSELTDTRNYAAGSAKSAAVVAALSRIRTRDPLEGIPTAVPCAPVSKCPPTSDGFGREY